MIIIELHDAIISEFDRALTRYGFTPYDFAFMAKYDDNDCLRQLSVTANIKPVKQDGGEERAAKLDTI